MNAQAGAFVNIIFIPDKHTLLCPFFIDGLPPPSIIILCVCIVLP